MKFRFLAPASIELGDAVAFYDAQRLGLGHQFAMAVQDSLSRIAGFPESYQRFGRYSRRCLVFGFPYGIFTSSAPPNRMFWWSRWHTFIAVLITGSGANHEARRIVAMPPAGISQPTCRQVSVWNPWEGKDSGGFR